MKNEIDVGIRIYTLIEWILDYQRSSNAYGFPFDRAHLELANRIIKAVNFLEEMKLPDDFSSKEFELIQKIYEKLKKLLQKVTENKVFQTDK